MFFHQYKYRLKYFSKTPTVLFWALIFPIILGTLFQATFGTLDDDDAFETIPVAIVVEQENDANLQFMTMMTQIKYDNDELMFDAKKMTKEEAIKLLQDEKITGIITLSDHRELSVATSGIQQSVLQQFLNQYLRSESYMADIVKNHPDKIEQAAANLLQSMEFTETTSLASGSLSSNTQYFYALIAMVCMFGSYLGINNAKDIQADLSPIAARRCVSTGKKFTLVCADSLAALTIHFTEIVLVFFYLRLIGVDLGHQPLLFFSICLVGSMIGILLGQFICLLAKRSENANYAICTSVSLILSFFSGLMASNMKDVVEKNAPILNRINPAALITDCFYCLTVFDDYTRFYRGLISLIIIAILLLLGTTLLIRRDRYESI